MKVNVFCGKHLVVLGMIAVLFGLNYLWTLVITPLFASLKPMAAMMADALLQTSVLVAFTIVMLYKLHISKDIDLAIAKCFKLKNKVEQ